MKKVLSFICFVVGICIISITVCGCKNTKKSYSAQNSTTTNTEASEQEMIISIDDIVEFQNLMEGCSGLTNQAKSNYQKARPSIEVIAKRNGFTIYEYHYINGDLGDGEMSSYCCYLYKNCTINKSETGYPTFAPTNNEVCCVLSDGGIIVYDKDSYDELVRQVKEKCGGKLHSETEDDGEESHFYSDGKYCYYMDCVGSGEYRIPIRKQVDENSADNTDGGSSTIEMSGNNDIRVKEYQEKTMRCVGKIQDIMRQINSIYNSYVSASIRIDDIRKQSLGVNAMADISDLIIKGDDIFKEMIRLANEYGQQGNISTLRAEQEDFKKQGYQMSTNIRRDIYNENY